jgi:hypothetical protein
MAIITKAGRSDNKEELQTNSHIVRIVSAVLLTLIYKKKHIPVFQRMRLRESMPAKYYFNSIIFFVALNLPAWIE